MKYIKAFENTNLQIGDYVICDESGTGTSDEIIDFLKNNIGQFIRFREDNDSYFSPECIYLVQYKDVPDDIIEEDFDHGGLYWKDENSRLMKRSEIKYWSKNKEDINQFILNNKFNI